MKQLRIYLDTSVIGGCLDPEFSQESLALLELARDGKVLLLFSKVFYDEIYAAPNEIVAILESLSLEIYEKIDDSNEARRMRNLYIDAKVVGIKSINDAHHVDLATVAKADLIVSWNFKHLVHFDKIRGFNAVNLREGHQMLEIRSPKEFV